MTPTPTLREAAQQALEALVDVVDMFAGHYRDEHIPENETNVPLENIHAAIESLGAALAGQAAEEVPTGCPYPRKCQFHGCTGECQAAPAAEQAEPVALTRERDARRAAQVENAELKERLARARIDLMRELREQGWTPAPARQEPLNRTAIFNGWLRSRDISEDSYVMFEVGARYAESFYGITAAPAEGGAA